MVYKKNVSNKIQVSLMPSTKGKEMINVTIFFYLIKDTIELTGKFIGNNKNLI